MTPEDWRRVRPILAEALELPAGKRDAFLDSACGGDQVMRSQIVSMIRAGEMDGGLIGATAAEPALAAAAPLLGGPGPRVGRYQIKRLIGAGGMGAVYEALQEHPRRTVALKVMRKGIASRSALRRFEYEAQLLGRLRHPGIAQVFEAGTHHDGAEEVPYFAMEYIPAARTLTDYAASKHLGTRERLDLFIKVCDSVHHGHTKGIIHRDLKPANILVDSSGQPKIIDFGVARTTDSDMAAVTLQTDVGQLVGTLQYMSPEQCAADPHDIDTRADVYSLGVLLYELLCGKAPHDLTGASVLDAARIVRETPAPRPSTINATLRGDLETVTLKAMDKDRDRRYRSASELADDLKRYLNSEPISARPASLVYQLRMFGRRNRALVTLVSAAVVLLCLAVVGISWAAVQINSARTRAQTQAENAEALNTYLREMLTLAAPSRAQGSPVTVRDAVDLAASKLSSFSPEQAEVEAGVRAVIGTTYRALGAYDAAEPHLRRALELRRERLGENHPLTLTSVTDMAALLNDRGDGQTAAQMLRDTLNAQTRLIGPDAEDTLRTKRALAWVYHALGRSADAEVLFKSALDGQRRTYGSASPQAVKSMTELAMVLIDEHKLKDAESLLDRAVEAGRLSLGEKHPDFLYTNHIRGWLLTNQEKYEEALKTFDSVVAAAKGVMPPNHHWTLIWTNSLGWGYVRTKRFAEAELILRDALGRERQLLGDSHRDTLYAEVGLASAIAGLNRLDEAETHALRVYDLTADRGPRWLTTEAAESLVQIYEAKHDTERAAKYRALLPVSKENAGR